MNKSFCYIFAILLSLSFAFTVQAQDFVGGYEEDAEEEAGQSEELFNTAKQNLKATIEGLLFPVLNVHGYSLTWNE